MAIRVSLSSSKTLRRAGCSDAFTLVELLTVIAIVALLLAVTLPAIQRAREAARRLACLSNVRQIATAVLNYESTNLRYPSPGDTVCQENGVCVPHKGKQLSWIVRMLPFLEEQPLYDQFDMGRSVFDQGPSNPAAAQPEALLCASGNALGRIFVDEKYSNNVPLGKANYAAWTSPYHMELHALFPGAVSGTEGIRAERVTDGLSKTFMISEVRTRADVRDPRGAWAVPWNGSCALAADAHHDHLGCTGTSFCLDSRRPFAHLTPNHQGYSKDVVYYCDEENAELDRMPCFAWDLTTEHRFFQSAPRSNHNGGVNVTFMDGHGKFVVDEIDPIVMALRVSVNDGETP